MTLAGVLAALRRTKTPLTEARVVCLGAGSAGLGVCNTLAYGVPDVHPCITPFDIMTTAMTQNGLSLEKANENFWMVDQHVCGILSVKNRLVSVCRA